MKLTKQTVQALHDYLNKQVIDLNDNKLYDGKLVNEFMKDARRFLELPEYEQEKSEEVPLYDKESQDAYVEHMRDK